MICDPGYLGSFIVLLGLDGMYMAISYTIVFLNDDYRYCTSLFSVRSQGNSIARAKDFL